MAEGVFEIPDISPRDAHATCLACGRRGTAAWLAIAGEPPEVRRYCAACWPAARDAFEAEMAAQRKQHKDELLAGTQQSRRPRDGTEAPPTTPRGWSMHSRVWDDVRRQIARMTAQENRAPGRHTAFLEAMARGIAGRAGEYDGPMPADIASFVALYDTPPVE